MAQYSAEDFIRLNDGELMDYDQAYGAQCVDLFNYYNQQVIGAPWIGTPDTGGAADLWNDFDRGAGPQFYCRIPNTPDGVPQYGDVVIWAANVPGLTGPAGHVGIFVSGDANSLDVFNQNYPTGSNCHVLHFDNYTGVYGWLRPLANDPVAEPQTTSVETAPEIAPEVTDTPAVPETSAEDVGPAEPVPVTVTTPPVDAIRPPAPAVVTADSPKPGLGRYSKALVALVGVVLTVLNLLYAGNPYVQLAISVAVAVGVYKKANV